MTTPQPYFCLFAARPKQKTYGKCYRQSPLRPKSGTFCGVVCLARQAVLAFAALSSNTNLQSFYHVDFRRCSHDLATLCLKSNSPRENQSSARKCASADTDEVASRGFGSAGVVPRMSPLSKPVARVVHASLLRQSLGDINSSLRSLILRIVESLFGIFILFGRLMGLRGAALNH